MTKNLIAKRYAWLRGYFWLPCPACGVEFGGWQWRSVNGHFSDVPDLKREHSGYGICPRCTAAGVGCRAWAALETDGKKWHAGCEFAQPVKNERGWFWYA